MRTASSTWIGTIITLTFGLATSSGCRDHELGQRTAGAQPTNGSAAAPSKASPTKAEPLAGRDLAAKYLDCATFVNSSRWGEFKSNCLASSFVSHPIGEAERQGPDGLVDWMKDMKMAFPDVKYEPQLVLVNGRNILGMMLVTGTHKGTLKMADRELAATNKPIGQLFFHRLVFGDDNKLTEEWAFMDPGTLMGQLGKAPKGMGPMRKAMDKGLAGAPIIVTEADDAREKSNLAVVRKWNDDFSAHRIAELMAAYTDDAIESDQANASDWKGKKAIEKENRKFFRAFPDAKVEAPTMLAAGDYVVSIGKLTGTNQGDLDKMKKTGKTMSVDYAEVLKLENGRIAQIWRFRSGPQMMQQLGMMPEPGASKPETTRPRKQR